MKDEVKAVGGQTIRRLDCLLPTAFLFILHPSAFILSLKARRVSLRRLARLPEGVAFERLDGSRLVEVYNCVELLGELRVEVVAQPLGLRSVDDADGALQARLAQKLARRAPFTKVQHEARRARVVKERLVATL